MVADQSEVGMGTGQAADGQFCLQVGLSSFPALGCVSPASGCAAAAPDCALLAAGSVTWPQNGLLPLPRAGHVNGGPG